MDNKIMKSPGRESARFGKRKRLLSAFTAVCAVVLTAALLLTAQAILIPKYPYASFEEASAAGVEYGGGMMREYYASEVPHDVLLLGDCEFFEGISTVELWREYGISSYLRGSPQQLIWQSYYILLDTLKHETPKVVVFNAMEMKIGEAQSEAYTHLTLDGLRSPRYRVAAAGVSLTEEEQNLGRTTALAGYLFPIVRYHSRWSELGADDIRFAVRSPEVTFNGYLMMTGTSSEEPALIPPINDMPELPQICWEYLDKMRELCAEKGIGFMLFKAPTQSRRYYWFDEWEAALDEYAEKNGVLYVNGIEHRDEIGLEMASDSYDRGVHLNVSGAEKTACFLGGVLKEQFDLPDRSSQSDIAALWAEIEERYDAAKKAE